MLMMPMVVGFSGLLARMSFYVPMAFLDLFRGAVKELLLPVTIAITGMFLFFAVALAKLFWGAIAFCRAFFGMDTIKIC